MIVFKTFWKVVSKYKGTIIMYSLMLIIFGAVNMSTSDNQVNFINVKPDVLIINEDKDNIITNNLVKYISDNSNVIDVNNDEEDIDDALFYRDVNYVIYIKDGYGTDVMSGKDPSLDIKSTGDYNSALENMMLSKYIKLQNIYRSVSNSEEELISLINANLDNETDVEITSKLDTSKTSNATFYFNFASYSLMAVIIFVICLVISSFKEDVVNKRTLVSSMNYKKYNRYLLFSSFAYSGIIWFLFNLLGVIILGDVMLSLRGIFYMINSFVFTFCSLTLALLISSLVRNKEAVNGIVNVIALGSAFLCGAFVPAEWLPGVVLKIAHILPAYYYINSNDLLKSIEVININSVMPIIINMMFVIVFSVLFIIINNMVTRLKLKE